jgi:hypothetical protein
VLNVKTQDEVLKALEPFKLDGAVQKITCPFLMLHGEGDEQIPLPEAKKCFDAVGSTQKTFKLSRARKAATTTARSTTSRSARPICGTGLNRYCSRRAKA